MADALPDLADLAVHYWKLCRALEHELAFLPEDRTRNAGATLRYARSRLDAILARHDLRLITYDGEPWSAALPVSPLNPDDVGADALVDTTIEPTLLGPHAALVAGKVLLRNR